MKTHINTIRCTAILLLGITAALAQNEDVKAGERYNTNANVGVFIDSQNTDLVFEDWNKDEVEVEAVLETEGLNEEQRQKLLDAWQFSVRGNSGRIDIKSSGSNFDRATVMGAPGMDNLDDMIASSMAAVRPLMQNMMAPMLKSMSAVQLPQAYYDNMKTVQFDYNAYKKEGEKYLKAYQKKMESSFGDDFDKVMQRWAKENESKIAGNSSFLEGLKKMPQSPFGKNINFDTTAYKKDKKAYTSKLNNAFGTNVSVKDVDHWLAAMEDWGDTFGKQMEAWGQNFGAAFGQNMEAWGQNLGNAMERDMANWGDTFGKNMEAWSQQLAKNAEQMAQNQSGNYKKTVTRDANGNIISTQINFSKTISPGNAPSSGTVKRKIIVHMPKAAKLDLNVRHGNIKIGEASDARVNLSHGNFIAQTIDGSKTYVTVAYSPVDVNNWNYGTLRTSYVKNCVINQAEHINIDSRASNIVINEVGNTAIIHGSFGELTVPKVGRNFHTINISLENSDLVLRLPDTAYNFSYNGVRSNLNFPEKLDAKVMRGYGSQMVNGFYKKEGSEKSITISSKFSDVVVN